MKKLFALLFTILLVFPLFGQEPERELSDYEKYRLEQEARLYPEDEDFLCWDVVEEMPKFNGKKPDEFKKWISLNVEYPKEAIDNKIRGKVFVEFIVDKYGNVVRVKVPKSVDPILDAEAIRVVELSPKWSPGFQNGTPVNVQFTFPINFVLKDEIQEGPAVVNNYYNYDYDYGYRSRLYFDTWYYSPYHSYYDPFYYPYYGYGYYPYYGYNYYPYHIHYYPNYHYGYNPRPPGKLYAKSNTLGWNRSYYQPYNRTNKNGYVNSSTAMKKSVSTRPQTTRQVTTRTKTTYTPKYNRQTTTRQSYNKPVKTTKVTATRPQTRSTQTRSSYNRPARSNASYTRPSTTSRPSYNRPSTPSRSSSSYNRSSTPSRSSSSYRAPSRSSSSYSRPSSSSSSGRSYSSGSAVRGSSGRK